MPEPAPATAVGEQLTLESDDEEDDLAPAAEAPG
jgi:hypothetical protein